MVGVFYVIGYMNEYSILLLFCYYYSLLTDELPYFVNMIII